MPPSSEPAPDAERRRLDALRSYDLLDPEPLPQLDRITALAATLCRTPISLVTLVDDRRQWFLSRFGLDAQETTRGHAFCAHALSQDDLLEVADATKDPRFSKNPYVLGDPFIRFYAGMPLCNQDGDALGTLCVIDRKPRTLSADERNALRTLRDFTMAHLELRRRTIQLIAAERRSREIIDNSLGLVCAHGLDGVLRQVNPAAAANLGLQPDDMVGHPLTEFMLAEDAHQIPAYLARLADIGRDEGMLPVRGRDGQRRVWRYKAVVSQIAGEEPLVVGHALDVTDEVMRAPKA